MIELPILQTDYFFVIEPVAKPRMTQRDKWAQRDCVVEYWAFANKLTELTNKQYFALPDYFDIDFYISMPKSWSEKKKLDFDGKPHQVKKSKDRDNLLKAVQDVLRPDNDGQIWGGRVCKWWSREGGIKITV